MIDRNNLLSQTASAFHTAAPAAALHTAAVSKLTGEVMAGTSGGAFRKLIQTEGALKDLSRPWERFSTTEGAVAQRIFRSIIDHGLLANCKGYLEGYQARLMGLPPDRAPCAPLANDLDDRYIQPELAKLGSEARARVVGRITAFLECSPEMRYRIASADTPEKQDAFMRFVGKRHKDMVHERAELQVRLEHHEKMLEWLDLVKAAAEFAVEPTSLEAAQESWLYKLSDAYASGVILNAMNLGKGGDEDYLALSDRGITLIESTPEIFVVQHDWAAAFQNATDYATGEWRLQAEGFAFEFQFVGFRAVAFAHSDNGIPEWMHVFVRCKNNSWVEMGTIDAAEMAKGGNDKLSQIMLSNIRAMCIALDAEVIEREVIRASHLSNQKRTKAGRASLRDFHIVSLARRSRAASLEHSAGDLKRKVRLHFRRGHWRHFQSHKTWIKWMLVGNPDLGFINKEYRL